MSWQASFRNSIKSLSELRNFYADSPEHLNQLPMATKFNEKLYPIFIPINLASKIKSMPTGSSLWKQFIPQENEQSQNESAGLTDPIGDQVHQKTKQLIHRYPSRALFLPTNICPVHCRYCFRKNELYTDEKTFSADLEESLHYLKNNTQINEIIFTGGDPLILSDQKLEFYLQKFSQISHIKFIRFHSRTPVIIPQRLNETLSSIFNQYSKRFQILLGIHINHIDEWNEELEANLKPFHSTVTLLSQTVLLKGVNDSSDELVSLFKTLSFNKIRPYYLHHPDQARGTQHFWLSIEEGREIYRNLRKELSGWMLPEYIIDIPGGYGKSPAYNPESISSSGQIMDIYGEIRDISSLDKNL